MNNHKVFLSMAGVAASLIGLSSSASALSPVRPGVTDSLVSKVATVCIRDDRGWHHMNGKRRVSCRPANPGKGWAWHTEGGRSGWWHKTEHRWND